MKTRLPDNEKAVWLLKTKGPQALASLAETMMVTTEGARFQLLKLSNEGLVEARTESKGRGRPQQIWSLTAAGHARFPDTHADLTVRLIQKMRETLGENALDAVIEANGRDGQAKYIKELENLTGLEERIDGLAKIRDREGYMASYTKQENEFLLIENHCPICAAASACMGFCKSELETFSVVLGDQVEVKRVDHILAGARRCAYQITPRLIDSRRTTI
jgi:predicted ArsR family transcriptional regulator